MSEQRRRHPTVRGTEIDVAEYLLCKLNDEFNEALWEACDAYVKKHKDLLKELKRLRAAEPHGTNNTELPLRIRISDVFDRPFESRVGTALLGLTTAVIVLSVVCLVIETVPQYNPTVVAGYYTLWVAVQGFVNVYFVIELTLRFAVAPARLELLKRFTTVADLLALVPYFVYVATGFDSLAPFQMLRLLRIFILFRRFRSVDVLFDAIWSSARVLAAPLLFAATTLLIMSSALYYAERGSFSAASQTFMTEDCTCTASSGYMYGTTVCPEVQSNFFSIPYTLWWAVVTISTVGYGDLVPICPLGKFVASVTMVLGVILIAMPIAIVSSYFSQSVHQRAVMSSKTQDYLARQSLLQTKLMDNEQDKTLASASPATVKFLRFFQQRLSADEPLHVAAPSSYSLMLLDFYFGTRGATVHSSPPAITYELMRIGHASASGSTGSDAVNTPLARRLTLNTGRTLVIGAASSHPDMPQPDLVLPSFDHLGQPYRLSSHHATIRLGPQYSDELPTLSVSTGCVVYCNNELVGPSGVRIKQGDLINFHDQSRPLIFRVEGVHPFALDL